jgi:hypothetical protein
VCGVGYGGGGVCVWGGGGVYVEHEGGTVGRVRADDATTQALGPRVDVSQVPAAVANSSVDNASACGGSGGGGGQGQGGVHCTCVGGGWAGGRMRADDANTQALGPRVVVSRAPAAVANSSVDSASAWTRGGGGEHGEGEECTCDRSGEGGGSWCTA